jgi:hypothetical protein
MVEDVINQTPALRPYFAPFNELFSAPFELRLHNFKNVPTPWSPGRGVDPDVFYTAMHGRPISFNLPTMPQRYAPGVTGASDIVVTIGDLNINAPGGDPAQIAAAGNALMEQFRDEVTAIFHGIDRNFATETMA